MENLGRVIIYFLHKYNYIRNKLNKLGVQFHWKTKVRHLDTKEKKIWYRKNKNKLTFDLSVIPLDYTGSYHLWLTLPYLTKTTSKDFVESNIFLGNLFIMP